MAYCIEARVRERAIQQESLQRLPENPDLLKRLLAISLNYVSSEKKAGEELKHIEGRILKTSAGHEEHEWTSFAAMEILFDRLDRMYAQINKNEEL